LNKCDEVDQSLINLMSIKFPDAIIGSAFKNINLDLLKEKILDIYNEKYL